MSLPFISLLRPAREVWLRLLSGDEDAAPRHNLGKTFIRQHADRLPGSLTGHAVLLHERGLGRQPAPRRILAAPDRLAQDRGQLEIDGCLALMIDSHGCQCS